MLTRFHVLLGLLALPAVALLPPVAAGADDKEDPIIAFVKPKLKEPGRAFTLIVVVKVKDGEGKKFETAMAKAITGTRKEKGCIRYELNHDEEGKSYMVYERWKSLADLEAHLKTDHIKDLRAVLPDVTAGAPELRVLIPAGE